ncbi:MAG: molybdate ABC transporter permease subunit [Planctomycetes bacterium]|nr:molybdate ABC transporter permease subunit [Planctomycetota bacterium]
MNWSALILSLELACATACALLTAGLPLAWWIATTRSRVRGVVEAIVTLPVILPPTVVGFYLLILLGPRGPVGSVVQSALGVTIPFSFLGLLIASVLFNLPFALRPFIAALGAVDRRLIEASWCLGESAFMTFWRVALPLAWPGIVGGTVLAFAHTMGEFGVVLLMGGNIPDRTRTIAVDIYDKVQAMDYAGAHRSAAVLLGICFLALAVVFACQRQNAARGASR